MGKCGNKGVAMGKLWGKSVGLTQTLITVANNNSNTSCTNSNLANSTYPPPHTFIPALVSRISPTATPASPHPTFYRMPYTYMG